MLFQHIVVRNFRGDPENFLRRQKKGVSICLAKVEATDRINTENHCFVWNAEYYDEFRDKHYPDIIDNLDNIPIQLMGKYDVKDVFVFRDALEKIFLDKCWIRDIYEVMEGTKVIG